MRPLIRRRRRIAMLLTAGGRVLQHVYKHDVKKKHEIKTASALDHLIEYIS